jgi:hypothetical protein
MPIIDIHTHCSPRVAGDPFCVAEVMRGTPVGKMPRPISAARQRAERLE